MKRYRLTAIAAFLLSIVSCGYAFAASGKKVALVVGNGDYLHSVALPNPVGDSKLMAEVLRKAGFLVIEGSNLGKGEMLAVLDQFTEVAYDAEIALVFYAGHGLQVDGRNYLIPVDAELQNPAQLQTRTLQVEAILAALPPDPAVGVVILDACRDNPLARTLAASLPKSRSSAVGTGLAVVQANEQASTSGGLLIAYATDPGSVAYDGNNANSPYTTALAKHLAAPGVEIQSALTRVRAEVADTTKGAQRPWHNASLAREVFIGRTPTVANSTPIQMPTPAATTDGDGSQINWTVEQAVWEEASKRNTIAHYEFYISQYPQGRFVNLALLNIKQLKESGQNQDNIPGTPAGAGETKIATAVPTADNATRSEGSSTNQDSIPSTPLEAGEIEIAAAVPADQNTTKSEVSGSAPGTPQTEAQLNWDKEDRIDLQLRLRALGLYADDVDGALGARSRAAIAAWQRQRGIVETTYLSAEQHMLLVVQSDPFIAKVRAEYEAMQAAKFQQQTVEKAKPKTVSGGTKKRRVASQGDPTVTEKPKKSRTCYDIASQSHVSCASLGTGTKKRQQAASSSTSKPKATTTTEKPCTKYDITSQSYERC